MKKLLNLFTVAPLVLWGGTSSSISRVLMNIISVDQRLSILFAFILMYIIFIFYYVLLISYLRIYSNDTYKYKLYCAICLVVGTAFTIFSLLLIFMN